MKNAFVDWAEQYIESIEKRIPALESRLISMSVMRNGERVDTTQDHIDELKRQKAELTGLIDQHNPSEG